MSAAKKYYQRWIKTIAEGDTKAGIRRHIVRHAKDIYDPEKNNPVSWLASMYNLLKIYETIYGVRSTTSIQIYKLLKKYNKNPRVHTAPSGNKIPKNIRVRKVEARIKK